MKMARRCKRPAIILVRCFIIKLRCIFIIYKFVIKRICRIVFFKYLFSFFKVICSRMSGLNFICIVVNHTSWSRITDGVDFSIGRIQNHNLSPHQPRSSFIAVNG